MIIRVAWPWACLIDRDLIFIYACSLTRNVQIRYSCRNVFMKTKAKIEIT